MRINSSDMQNYNVFTPPIEELLPPPAKTAASDPNSDLAAILERSERAAQNKLDGPVDISGALTSRLVLAQRQDNVRLIISEAYKSLGEWLKAAVDGENAEQAFNVIRRLNRLIRRAIRKIADLNKEDLLRVEHKRAEKKAQEIEAKKIEAELKRRMAERKQRENGYLRGGNNKMGISPNFPNPLSLSELQAKIQALAAEMTTLTMNVDAAVADVSSGGGEIAAPAGEVSAG
jgi:hypothetical protein